MAKQKKSSLRSEADAVAALGRIKQIAIEANAIEVDMNAEVARIQTESEALLSPLRLELAELERELELYVFENRTEFIEPRKHLCLYGQYGLHTAPPRVEFIGKVQSKNVVAKLQHRLREIRTLVDPQKDYAEEGLQALVREFHTLRMLLDVKTTVSKEGVLAAHREKLITPETLLLYYMSVVEDEEKFVYKADMETIEMEV